MRRYDDGNFIANEPDRRSIRDQYRDKFFGGLGVERLKDPFDHDPDPMNQLELVEKLMEKALAIHDGDKSGLMAAKAAVSSSALGIPLVDVGFGSEGRPELQATTVRAMADAFFHRWVGLVQSAQTAGEGR